MRAELFQHQPSSTPISRHGKSKHRPICTTVAWAPQGKALIHLRAAAMARRCCMAEDSPCLISIRVFWLVIVGSPTGSAAMSCHHHDNQPPNAVTDRRQGQVERPGRLSETRETNATSNMNREESFKPRRNLEVAMIGSRASLASLLGREHQKGVRHARQGFRVKIGA